MTVITDLERHQFVADDLDPENKLGPVPEASRIEGCLECTESEDHPVHLTDDGSPVRIRRFTYSGQDKPEYRAVSGGWVTVLGPLHPDKYDRAETGLMLRFRAENGLMGEAFANELSETIDGRFVNVLQQQGDWAVCDSSFTNPVAVFANMEVAVDWADEYGEALNLPVQHPLECHCQEIT